MWRELGGSTNWFPPSLVSPLAFRSVELLEFVVHVEDRSPTPVSGGRIMEMGHVETKGPGPGPTQLKAQQQTDVVYCGKWSIETQKSVAHSRVDDDPADRESNERTEIPTCLRTSCESANAAMPGCRAPMRSRGKRWFGAVFCSKRSIETQTAVISKITSWYVKLPGGTSITQQKTHEKNGTRRYTSRSVHDFADSFGHPHFCCELSHLPCEVTRASATRPGYLSRSILGERAGDFPD